MAKRAVDEDPMLLELTAIKRLLILQLLRDGVSQEDVAAVLGVSQSSVSRMGFPATASSASRTVRRARQ